MAEPSSADIGKAALLPDKILTGIGRPDVAGKVEAVKAFGAEQSAQNKINAIAKIKVETGDAKKAQEMIGNPQDNGSYDRTAKEDSDRYKKIAEQNALLEQYFNTDFDTMLKNDYSNAVKLQDMVKEQYLNNPLLAEYKAQLTHPDNETAVRNFIQDRLRDPEFRNALAGRFNEATKVGMKLSGEEIMDAQTDILNKRQDKKDKEELLKRAKRSRTQNETILKDNLDGRGNAKGDLADFRDKRQEDDKEHKELEEEMLVTEMRMKKLKKSYYDNPADATAKSNYKDASDEYDKKKDLVDNSRRNQRIRLEKQVKEAQDAQQDLLDAETSAQRALTDADRNLQRADLRLKNLTEDRKLLQEQYEQMSESIGREATQDWVQAKADQMSELNDRHYLKTKAEGEEKTKKDSEDKKAKFESRMANTMLNRYSEKRANWRGKEKYKYNKEQINADYELLLDKAGGAEFTTYNIMRNDAINAGLIDATANKDTFYKALGDAGISAKDLQAEVTAQIMQKKFATGGVPKHEAAFILNTQWGQQAIAKGLEKNHEFRALMNQIDKDGYEQKGKFRRLIQYLKDKPFLLGFVFLVGAGMKLASEGEEMH